MKRIIIILIFSVIAATIFSCSDIINSENNLNKEALLPLIDSNLIERNSIIPVSATANIDTGHGNFITDYVYGSDSASIFCSRKSSVLRFILIKNNLDSLYIKITSVKSLKGFLHPVYFPEEFNFARLVELNYPYYLRPGKIEINIALIPLTELMETGRNDDYIIINNNSNLMYHIIITVE